MPDARMRQYIPCLFKKNMVNLSKTKKAKLKLILYPILEHHDALMKTNLDLVSDMSIVYAATPSEDSVEEV